MCFLGVGFVLVTDVQAVVYRHLYGLCLLPAQGVVLFLARRLFRGSVSYSSGMGSSSEISTATMSVG